MGRSYSSQWRILSTVELFYTFEEPQCSYPFGKNTARTVELYSKQQPWLLPEKYLSLIGAGPYKLNVQTLHYMHLYCAPNLLEKVVKCLESHHCHSSPNYLRLKVRHSWKRKCPWNQHKYEIGSIEYRKVTYSCGHSFGCGIFFHFTYNSKSSQHMANGHIDAIEMSTVTRGNEKLGIVRVRFAVVCHTDNAFRVLKALLW